MGIKLVCCTIPLVTGVELWRQQVLTNIAEFAKILLQQGADKNALMMVYGGEFTAYALA
ncbi:MAG: hypothetical protein OER83_01835 [Flavobacteriaceae bacterium]|nr:hypothetical protein [Flavobacteriaceae bacterium]MDH3795594.1 hypothetical protein [Flavobacteriaceae bacterium]